MRAGIYLMTTISFPTRAIRSYLPSRIFPAQRQQSRELKVICGSPFCYLNKNRCWQQFALHVCQGILSLRIHRLYYPKVNYSQVIN
jgi:hypothetical protein